VPNIEFRSKFSARVTLKEKGNVRESCVSRVLLHDVMGGWNEAWVDTKVVFNHVVT
jgi:hypothetical protein